jgi:cysteine synthase
MMMADYLQREVGNTPLACIARPGGEMHAAVLAKVEGFNPTGSVKDRVAFAMIRAAEDNGRIAAGSTIVEASSGNTGVALARVASRLGYPAIVVMPTSASRVKVGQIRAYGAEIIHTPAIFGMAYAYAEAYRVAERIPGAFVPDQSRNPVNPAIHSLTTGPEIWASTGGRVDVLVAGVGTGGTITGVAQYLCSQRPDVEIVAVEPSASPVLSGGAPGPHRLTGIGPGYMPELLRRELITRIETVSEGDAAATRKEVARATGVRGGPSSGAAAYVALRLGRDLRYAGKIIVTIFPDRGDG